ncbi:MAG: hypothetical protein IAE98_00200 [Candidatus Kapabacteria bacterium]|nr:hypothetical protein [Candidatus Kapabacteria bacterium]
MRKKINDDVNLDFRPIRKSNFYRRFNDQFNRLLNQDKQSRDFKNIDEVYIEQEILIEGLNDFVNTQKDYCVFLIGLTGIGKSTNLKYFFGFEEQRPLVLNKTLVLPILCNSAFFKGVDIKKKIADMVETMCDFIQKKENISFSAEDLYEFIEINKPEVLARARKRPQPKKTENINWLYEEYKFEYSTELLKMYLLNTNIENFVIVIDDIDSIHDWNILIQLIHQACQVWECLKNNKEKEYNVKLIIAERPETHRFLCNKIDWFKAYIWGDPIYLNTTPKLHDLFKIRFDCITKALGGPRATNIEKWNVAYETLIKICTKLSIKHHDLITALNNSNVRDSLSTIEQILSIGKWLEKNPTDEYYFETTDQEFIDHIDLIRTLRSIAYQDRSIYIALLSKL